MKLFNNHCDLKKIFPKRKYLSLLCYINICFCVVKVTTHSWFFILMWFVWLMTIISYASVWCLRTSYVTYVPLFQPEKTPTCTAPLLYFCQRKKCASHARMVINLRHISQQCNYHIFLIFDDWGMYQKAFHNFLLMDEWWS